MTKYLAAALIIGVAAFFAVFAYLLVSGRIAIVVSAPRSSSVTKVAVDELPVYPPTAKALKPISLPDLIFLTLPPAGTRELGWDLMLDDPSVLWITPGYLFTKDYASAYRVGLARVRVDGATSTILRQYHEELAWSITLSSDNADLGPEKVELKPGTPADDCFGPLTGGCTFTVQQAIASTKFRSDVVCIPHGLALHTEVIKITGEGKEPKLLVYTDDGGSGGEHSSVEIHPLSDQQKLCSSS